MDTGISIPQPGYVVDLRGASRVHVIWTDPLDKLP